MSQPGGYTEKGLRWIVMEIVVKVLALHCFHKINVTKLYWAVLIFALFPKSQVILDTVWLLFIFEACSSNNSPNSNLSMNSFMYAVLKNTFYKLVIFESCGNYRNTFDFLVSLGVIGLSIFKV